MSIIRHNAFMRITSKILGVNQISLDMIPNSVKTGKAGLSLPAMKKDAND